MFNQTECEERVGEWCLHMQRRSAFAELYKLYDKIMVFNFDRKIIGFGIDSGTKVKVA